jgi:hypothetical protein
MDATTAASTIAGPIGNLAANFYFSPQSTARGEAIGLDVAALALQRKKVVVQVGVERNAARRASLRAEAKRVELGHDVGEKDDEAAPKTCGRGLHGCTNVSDDKLCRKKESDFKVAALCMQVFGDL